MDAANAGITRPTLRHALAGLEAGMLGALLMLAWLMLSSAWNRRSVWIVPNLFATTFYGPEAYGGVFHKTTWSGIALLLAIYGLGGAIWGIVWGDERRRFLVLLGAATGFAVYLLLFDVIWKHVNPLFSIYAPYGRLRIAHVLWGMMLARSPQYSGEIARAYEDPGFTPQEAAAMNRGEFI